MSLSLSDKIFAYIYKIDPTYVYRSMVDFEITDDESSVRISKWDPSFHISQPTTEQLNTMVESDVILSKSKKVAHAHVDVVENTSKILNPIEGNVVYSNNQLKIYTNGTWVSPKEIADLAAAITSLSERIAILENPI